MVRRVPVYLGLSVDEVFRRVLYMVLMNRETQMTRNSAIVPKREKGQKEMNRAGFEPTQVAL